MALIPRTNARPEVVAALFADQIPDVIAGEDLDVGDPCYIKSSDGRAYKSNGTSANEAARIHGYSPRAAFAGQPVTLLGPGCRFRYGTGLTPGTPVYLAATAGRLDTAATTGGTAKIGFAISTTDVKFSALAP